MKQVYRFFVDRPFKDGEVIQDNYVVQCIIGAGSYGIVYLCKDLKTQDNVVVKQLRPSKRRSKSEINLFENEVTVLRELDNMYIPKLYEVFLFAGDYFYVMSYIDGDDLDQQIFTKKKTFNEKEALLFLAKLHNLVTYLHSKDIYHLDLRIPNILLKNNEPYLIDFGLARKVNRAVLSKPTSIETNMKHQDYFDLGDILLFLLYTTYPSKTKKVLPWTEELSIEMETTYLLKRLLRIENPYLDTSEISIDIEAAIKAVGNI